jgi:hypothetical protein
MAYPETQRVPWIDQLDQKPKTIGRIIVGEKRQQFDSSFLPSRRQSQFVVHRSRPNIGVISLDANRSSDIDGMGADAAKSRQAVLKNGFNFSLERLILRNGDQEYWAVDSVGPLETIAAVALDPGDASKKLGALYNDFRPLMKASTEARRYQNSGSPHDLLREVARSVSPQLTNYDGVMESNLRYRLQNRLEIPIGSFIAISSVSDDVIAIEDVQLVDSVRYVMGTFDNQDP